VLKYFFDHQSSTSVVSNWADTFNLSAVTNYTKYTGLFDQFRIDKVECQIVPNITLGSSSERGVLISAIDINDAAAPTIAILEAQNNSLETHCLVGHHHAWKPAILDDSTTSVNDFVSCGQPATAWYGLKSSVAVTTSVIYYHYFVKMYVTFRGQGV